MDKQKALARLTEIEKETAALRVIIEAPEAALSLLTKPQPGSENVYYAINGAGTQKYNVNEYKAFDRQRDKYTQGNIFQTEALANDYADALDVFLLLRHQPGTVGPTAPNAYKVIRWQLKDSTCYIRTVSHQAVATEISPCFVSEDAAKAAIEAVGNERIIRMFKTFHHID